MVEKIKSPISSSTWSIFCWSNAVFSSFLSSSIFFKVSLGFFQSKPFSDALFCNFIDLSIAGKQFGISPRILSFPFFDLSFCLIVFQFFSICFNEFVLESFSNTCGCLLTIFLHKLSMISLMSKFPFSLLISAWKITWSNKSPNSSHKATLSFFSIASTTS